MVQSSGPAAAHQGSHPEQHHHTTPTQAGKGATPVHTPLPPLRIQQEQRANHRAKWPSGKLLEYPEGIFTFFHFGVGRGG